MSININKSSITNLAIFGSVASFFILINSDGLGAVDNSNPSNIMYWFVIASSAYLFLRIIIHLGSLKYESLTVNKYKYLNPLYYSLLLVLLIFGSSNFAKYGYKIESKFEPAFEEADSNLTRILILPFDPKRNCTDLESNYEDIYANYLNTKYNENKIFTKTLKRNVHIYVKRDTNSCILNLQEAINIGKLNNSDVVIFGEYDETCNSEFDILLKISETKYRPHIINGVQSKDITIGNKISFDYVNELKYNKISSITLLKMDSLTSIPLFRAFECKLLEYAYFKFLQSKIGPSNTYFTKSEDNLISNLLSRDTFCNTLESSSRSFIYNFILKNNYDMVEAKDFTKKYSLNKENVSWIISTCNNKIYNFSIVDTSDFSFFISLYDNNFINAKSLIQFQFIRFSDKLVPFIDKLVFNQVNEKFVFNSVLHIISKLYISKNIPPIRYEKYLDYFYTHRLEFNSKDIALRERYLYIASKAILYSQSSDLPKLKNIIERNDTLGKDRILNIVSICYLESKNHFDPRIKNYILSKYPKIEEIKPNLIF